MNDESDSSDDGMSSGSKQMAVHSNPNFDPNPHPVTVVKTSTGM
jgi:hypothetical protein